MKPPRKIHQIQKINKKNDLKEDDIKKMEQQLKNLQTFVAQDSQNMPQQKKWITANTNKPLMNYGKQILQKRSQSQTQKIPAKIQQEQEIQNTLSQSLNDFLILFNCNKYWKEFQKKNIQNLQDLQNYEDINDLDIPPGFKIKLRLKLQKMFKIEKKPISYQTQQQNHFIFQDQSKLNILNSKK